MRKQCCPEGKSLASLREARRQSNLQTIAEGIASRRASLAAEGYKYSQCQQMTYSELPEGSQVLVTQSDQHRLPGRVHTQFTVFCVAIVERLAFLKEKRVRGQAHR